MTAVIPNELMPVLESEVVLAYVSFYACIVYHFIYEVCSYSWSDLSCRNVENLTSEPANLSHALLLLFIENGNIVSTHGFPF